jgi:hypothetical protein
MLLRTAMECETAIPVGEAYRIAYRECLQTIAAGGIYNYEPGMAAAFSFFAGGATPVFLVALPMLVAIVATIASAVANNRLTTAQKWGYAVGAAIFPVVFIPLYLILAPAPDPDIKKA